MPELPEIETIARGLREKVLGSPILSVQLGKMKVVRNGREEFIRELTGRRITGVRRRGKMIIMELEPWPEKGYLLARLGMTGRLVYFGEEDALWGAGSFRGSKSYAHRHCHAVLTFRHQGVLLFCDARRFGYLEVVDERGLEERLMRFGPEPLERSFTLAVLRGLLTGRKTTIKAFLLDQRRVAGIGNIYADEILYAAGVDPRRMAGSLSLQEVEAVHGAIKRILRQAVEARGTTFSDYVDADGREGGYADHLQVYGRGGEECRICAGRVEQIRIAGRGTYLCPRCQK